MFASDSRFPWGTYSVLESSERYKTKRVVVKPGKRLSRQNEGKLPLVIVEVPMGEYTDEDDVIRVEDDFHRKFKLFAAHL